MDDAVVGKEPVAARERREERADAPGHVERQGAVGEEVRVELEGTERELEDRVADRALVRVEEVILVEIEADHPEDEGGGEEAEEPRGEASDARSHGQAGGRRLPFRG